MTRTHIHFATGVPTQLQERFGLSSQSTHVPASEVPILNTQAHAEADNAVATAAVEAAAIADADAKAPEIKSGMRNSSTLLMLIDLRKALDAGIAFFLSANGVVLTPGDKNGVLGVEFFERVVEKGGGVLVRDGVVLSEKD